MIPAFWVFVAERGHSEAVFLGADLGVGSGIENFLTIADHLGGSGQIFVAKSGWFSLENRKAPFRVASEGGSTSQQVTLLEHT